MQKIKKFNCKKLVKTQKARKIYKSEMVKDSWEIKEFVVLCYLKNKPNYNIVATKKLQELKICNVV